MSETERSNGTSNHQPSGWAHPLAMARAVPSTPAPNLAQPWLNVGRDNAFIVVTPAMAAGWLVQNTGNRPLSDVKVEEYANLLIAGRWEVSHQGVGFSTEGVLIDGQHRLSAIVRANRPAEMAVTWGLAPAVFDVTDIGKMRTAADILSRRLPDVRSKNLVVATASIALRGLARQQAHEKRVVVDAAEGLIDLIGPFVNLVRCARRVGRAPVIAAFVCAVRDTDAFDGPKGHRDYDLVMEIARRFTATEFSPGDPMKALYRRLSSGTFGARTRGAVDSQSAYALTVMAIRNSLDGAKIDKLIATDVDWGDARDRIKPGTGRRHTVRR